ncbi:MAG: deoxyguanosinetriphosphate triphosphohydrolase [Pseudomonadota bacterium]
MHELASYAANPDHSRGRRHTEEKTVGRTEFQRDRDRIIHSGAFRRLEYKTQVFVNHEGDLFRTRLTHSIEVAQIGRSIARSLGLNEDLTEAIALAHDLGHTPFGHAGQDALNKCMREHGGFEHNLQSIRVVDLLEQRYAAFDGLNLCFETREGILKHCSRKNAALLGNIGERFLTDQQPSLEAQVANLADEVAYNNHDVDDGLRSGLVTVDQLREVSLFARHLAEVEKRFPGLKDRRLIHETVRRMINTLALDLTQQSVENIRSTGVISTDDVHKAEPLISFSEEIKKENQELKHFLRTNLYQHYQVIRMTSKAERIIEALYKAFSEEVRLLPMEYQQRAKEDRYRAVADYIAGMTDRYANKEYRRLFAVEEF